MPDTTTTSATTDVDFPNKTAEERNLEAVKEQRGQDIVLRHFNGATEVNLTQLKEASFNDLLESLGVVSAEQDEGLGSEQFGPVLTDKNALVGQPFLLVNWQFNGGDFGDFVTMFIITPDDKRYIVNDGSTSIRDQLQSLSTSKGVNGALFCKKGFRVSTYDKELPNGQVIKDAETFYIDTSL